MVFPCIDRHYSSDLDDCPRLLLELCCSFLSKVTLQDVWATCFCEVDMGQNRRLTDWVTGVLIWQLGQVCLPAPNSCSVYSIVRGIRAKTLHKRRQRGLPLLNFALTHIVLDHFHPASRCHAFKERPDFRIIPLFHLCNSHYCCIHRSMP